MRYMNDPAWIEEGYEDSNGPVRHLNPDAVKGNKYQCSGATLVRIPNVKGRIVLRSKNNWGDNYVEYIYERTYDKESKQTRNKRVIIGMNFYQYDGFMYPNENYFTYFDPETGELKSQPSEKTEKAEAEVGNDDTAAAEDRNPSVKEEKPVLQKEEAPMKKEQTPQDLERVVEAGKALMDAAAEQTARLEGEEEQDVQERYHTYLAFHDRFEMLRDIVLNFNDVIDHQTRKRPNAIVSLYTIRKINNIIRELKEMCAGTVLDGYVELIDEPKEVEDENGNKYVTGLSYNDVQIITRQNNTMLRWFRYNCLKTPGQFEATFGVNRGSGI